MTNCHEKFIDGGGNTRRGQEMDWHWYGLTNLLRVEAFVG